jgi:hypothetical protein
MASAVMRRWAALMSDRISCIFTVSASISRIRCRSCTRIAAMAVMDATVTATNTDIFKYSFLFSKSCLSVVFYIS